ncbi:anti-sigma factor domain-containing protein [Leifsonia poae]|uniref:anti-sigma factor n=1 Tax=Leifsonia poae TaxID=110933 RepID=UPI003D69D073
MNDEHDREDARLGYRLGAADEQEAAVFEDVAAQLALTVEPVQPRPELKAALFAKLAQTPQQAPTPQLPAQDAPALDAPVQDAPPTPAPAAPGPAERAAQRRWFQRPSLILGAAAAAVLLFIGGAFVGSALSGTNSYTSQQASALAQINAASDVQHATADVAGGGTATLVWSGELGKSALVANDLPALPGDKTYELWYIRDGQATPAGTMESEGTGSTWRVLSGKMSAGDTVGVTVEPRGGSKKPTTDPIVAISS